MPHTDVRATLVELLRHWHEARDPLNGPASVRGDGDSVSLMPATWTEDYRRLEQVLASMRQGAHKREWKHLVARHRDAPVVHMTLHVVTDAKGRPVKDKRGQRRLSVPQHCDLIAGGTVAGDRTSVALVRDARRTVHELSGRAYRRTHPDPLVVDRALELVARRWAEAGWPAPRLPKQFTEGRQAA